MKDWKLLYYDHVSGCINHFRHPNVDWPGYRHTSIGFPEVHDLSKVKTVVVDKDMNDIIALQKDMPQVSLQICKFHVLQAITREVRKTSCT